MLRLTSVFFFALIINFSKTKIDDWQTRENETEPQDFNNDDTLILAHVIFRHGNRTADIRTELYPKDPYLTEKYHPYGHGQLTKAGKQKEYALGSALRKRYNNLLGDYYYPDVIEAYTTDYNRTKMSLQLVLAGLFPPRKEDLFENDVFWQPVPFNYHPKHQDKVLLGVLCPKYLEIYDQINSSPEIVGEFNKYVDEVGYIAEHTGLNINRFNDVFNLYFGLSTEEEWGFDLPEWTKNVWPDTITNLATKDYFVSMATPDLRKMATGYFLQKVIEDTKSKIISSNVPGRKMHLYSSHENTLAELLISLKVFDKPHVPNYAAFLAFEVHFIDGVYGIKVFYENYEGSGPVLLNIPDCGSFCPLDKFIVLLQDYMPSEDLCGI